MQRQMLNGAWQMRQMGTHDWIDAQVPGDVHTTLMLAERIPDPFVGDNEKKVQWVTENDWEYHRSFFVDPDVVAQERVNLVCDGLDTLADVYLNDHWLGHTDNMFRQYTWQVKGFLREGENDLRIKFGAPVSYIREQQKIKPLIGGGDILGGPHLRKAPYMWGWDWGPKLPQIGIWKDIYLEGFSTARLADVYLRQRHEGGKVTVRAEVEVTRLAAGPLQAALRVTSPQGQAQSVQVVLTGEATRADLEVVVENPQLWWPNGYGEQPLYSVQVALSQPEGQNPEAALDQRSYQLGLRTVELRQQPDEWGELFTFVVNDIPVFIKGADWIPADAFPTRISDAYLEMLLQSAVAAHMNMLRVWGGGLYEEERFYNLCDRYGLLVWQDFTFACGIYPADDAFLANVKVEAEQNVRRLRHRTSLALWCGNNEMEQGWVDWGWNKPGDAYNQHLKAGYDRMFHHMLPDVVAALDPDHRYWPSSASSGIPFAEPNSQQRGDTHYWDVWHGRKPFTAYRSQYPRFMSEFGFQALPPLKTIQTYAEPKDQNMTSYIMEHHQRSGSGNGLMIHQMTDTFRMPKDFSSLVYLSMVLQAEGIRYGVEHWRRNRTRVGGTLYWQLNDCWPVASWSSLDYFGRWKALHYAARRFYAPVMLSIEDDGELMNVHVTSDLTHGWNGEVHWRLELLTGELLDSAHSYVEVGPLSNRLAARLNFGNKVNDENRRHVIFVCELWQHTHCLACKVAPFAPNKHLELADPQMQVKVSEQQGLLQYDITTQSLARFVELALEGQDVVFSDNYFDVPASCTQTVTSPLPEGWTVEQARQALRVRSLYDSF